MKKLLFCLCLLFIFCDFCYSQEIEDDFDDVFWESEDSDEAVIIESISENHTSSSFQVSGSVNADLGLIGSFENNVFNPGGYLGLESSIYLNIYPNDSFSFHTGITGNIKYYPSFSLNCFYFDYFFLNNIFISAGVKGVTWGYTRLFCDTDYYGTGKKGCGPQYTNIMSDSGSYVICQIRYPWENGTLSIIPMCPMWVVNSGKIGASTFEYALSYETTMFHTSVNLFARTGGNKGNFNPLIGLEVKKTIYGFDVYGQGIVKSCDYTKMYETSGYDYLTSTFGFYRLWDAFDPNFGLNFEYQVTRKIQNEFSQQWSHLIAFEGGIKRMGPNKNHKIGLYLHHDIIKKNGLIELAYLISSIFPYADWSNAFSISYGANELPVVQFGTAISMDLNF